MSVLQEMKDLCGSVLADGEFRKSSATESVAVINPATEEVIGEIPETPAAEIDEIVDAAHAAQKTWWGMSALERAETMHDIANDLHAIKPKLAEALTREMGKPYKESADEVDWSVSAIRYYAEIGRSDIAERRDGFHRAGSSCRSCVVIVARACLGV